MNVKSKTQQDLLLKHVLMKKIITFSRIVILVFLVFIIGCNKNEIGPQPSAFYLDSIPTIQETQGYFVINEGNFGAGNSSVSYLDWESQTMYNDYFYNKNGNLLGDVFQSMQRINDKYYLVINNSQKIVITDTAFVQQGEISGLTSPRYICQVDDQRAYVTDLFSNQIAIVDLTSDAVTGSIDLAGWTEEIKIINNKIWVANYTNSTLVVINPESDQIENTIQLSIGVSDFVVANDGSVWVLCDGGFAAPILPKLYHINANDFTIISTFDFEENQSLPKFLTYNSNADELYFYQGGVRAMSVTDSVLPTDIYIAPDIEQIYGLDYDAVNKVILLTDARDYVSQGKLLVYSDQGNWINTFTVGAIPNGIFAKN